MTPEQLARARERLGLTLSEMADMLGYEGEQRRQMIHKLEAGLREIRRPQTLLVEAYLSGYRPPNWPGK